ncbi:MAG: hypothetical protein ACLGHA_08490 [Gammaproteobacteria bacterium]
MQTRNDHSIDDCPSTLRPFAGVTDTAHAPARRSKRTHSWHASYAVLAVMTSLLLVSGCEKKDAAGPGGTDPTTQTAPESAPPPSAGYPSDPASTAPAPAPVPDAPVTTPPGTPEQTPGSDAPTPQP